MILNKSLEFAPALAGPPPDGFSAPLQTRRSARRWISRIETIEQLNHKNRGES